MKLQSPAFPRNRDPILGVLKTLWPTGSKLVLELASGPGQHAGYFAEALPHVRWQPSEHKPELLRSIDDWNSAVSNVRPAIPLNVTIGPWPSEMFHGAVAINFFHMVDLETVQCALAGLSGQMHPGGHAVIYDCFTYKGEHVSPSNARFDAHLRQGTPGGRVHAFEEVDRYAQTVGFEPATVHMLPANNQCVVWTFASPQT